MSRIVYQDFDLRIGREGDKRYCVKVIGSGGGDVTVTFSLADLQLPSVPPVTEGGHEAHEGTMSRHRGCKTLAAAFLRQSFKATSTSPCSAAVIRRA